MCVNITTFAFLIKNGNVNWTFSCSDGNVFIENRESVLWKNSNAKTT